jgi:hypothetical protein
VSILGLAVMELSLRQARALPLRAGGTADAINSSDD